MMPSPLDRSRLFLRLQLAGWLTNGLIGAGFVVATGYLSLRDSVVVILFRTLLGVVLTYGLRVIFQRLRVRLRNVWSSGAFVFLLSGLVAMVDGVITWEAALLLNVEAGTGEASRFFIASLFMRWMTYWLWSLLYFGINFWLDTEGAKLRLARAEAAARASELRFLQAQINPHFLFNALNTIQSETEQPETRSLIQALAEYLRFALRPHKELEPLGCELDALEHYLQVEKARFQERFHYSIDASEEARQICIPLATVQPLLENAVKYGRRTSAACLVLEIGARVMEGRLHLRVANSGQWVVPGEGGSTQTGVANLRRRLALIYGGAAELHFRCEAVTVCAEVSLPAGTASEAKPLITPIIR